MVGAFKPGDAAQGGGLAATRWAEQREDLAGGDAEGHVFDRGRRLPGVGARQVFDAQAVVGFDVGVGLEDGQGHG